ncbi:glycosyltransferase [Streptomyces europaeiscabiei]|uniref:glycosyltransferase n=1 Tax=Streptomyces europaeiscabiei TaxID=146819 RepID=UPI002E1544C7
MNEMNAGGVRQRSVEIVVPVYNEAHVLAGSVGRLHAYLEASFPFPFRITIADNASTDTTWETALALADGLPHVHAVHLDRKGRGRALKHVWSRSTADVVAYMDVDLSTGLEGFLPLVAPLLSGHSDLAIGSRLHRQADVVRGRKREFVSRSYNLLLKKNQDGATWLVAVATDQTASSIILESGQPVISMGGWSGSDEAMTLAKLKELVKTGKLHYIVVSDSGGRAAAAAPPPRSPSGPRRTAAP